MTAAILTGALAYYDAGASVIPVTTGPSKKPLLPEWATYQRIRASREQTAVWFGLNGRAIGVICGAVSDDREGVDIDNKPRPGYPDAEELINQMASMVDAEAPDVWDKLAIESSPNLGWHVLYRCSAVEGNLKLAMRPATDADRAEANNPKLDRVTIIETRGEGGYFISAPSPGYVVYQGDPANPPRISPAERAILFRAARALNLLQETPASPPVQPSSVPTGQRPGDLYNADMTATAVADLLVRHGWHRCASRGDGVILLRRPGKKHGWSATVGYGGTNLLRVFSSNGAPFDLDKSYPPFVVRTLLEFDGDFEATTEALVKEGYFVYQAQTGPLKISTPSLRLPPPITAVDMLALPAIAQVPDTLAAQGCPWLDAYVEHSRHWSPRSFDGFHEAVGVWVLSTVAARRVVVHFGREQFTPLFIALAGRSTIHAKTTAADVGIGVLGAAGLGWMLADDSATPQKFVRDRTQHVPDDYAKLTGNELVQAQLKLMFAGQVGWWYDEFGMLLHAMARSGSSMSDFSGLLRKFDDCAPRYVYATIGRPTDKIIAPYLALLASLTPADLRPLMKRGSTGWSDGFWARWAFITPPMDEVKIDRFPAGQRIAPLSLTQALRDWHERLGYPPLFIKDDRPEVGPLPQQVCTLAPGVVDAYYTYNDALIGLMGGGQYEDLDAWHGRLAMRAMRITALFASLDNDGAIEVRHWARAQQIAERWRFSLYRLYEQVNTATMGEKRDTEDAVMTIIRRLGNATVREITQRTRSLSATEIHEILEKLVRAGILQTVVSQRTTRYQIPTSVDMDTA